MINVSYKLEYGALVQSYGMEPRFRVRTSLGSNVSRNQQVQCDFYAVSPEPRV
jgi:hypothetical protein